MDEWILWEYLHLQGAENNKNGVDCWMLKETRDLLDF